MERGAIADMQQAETSKKVKVSKLIIAAAAAAILIGAGVLTAILIKNKISSGKNRTNPVLSISHSDPLSIDDNSRSPAGAFRGNERSFRSSVSGSMTTGLRVSCRAVEMLPDEYVLYGEWSSTVYKFALMQTTKELGEFNAPEFFYLLIPEKYAVDLTVYDTIVARDVQQFAYENQVVYDLTRQQPQMLPYIIVRSTNLGDDGWFDAYNFMAFSGDGRCDRSLWTANDAWAEMTASERKYTESGGDWWSGVKVGMSLTEVEQAIAPDPESFSWLKCRYLSSAAADQEKQLLEYLTQPENGLFVGSTNRSVMYAYPDVQTSFTRYICGYPTDEIYSIIGGEKITGPLLRFTDNDLKTLPDLPSAVNAVDAAFDAGSIRPPHIIDYQDRAMLCYGIFGFYAKTADGVVGVVRVSWQFKGDKEYYNLYDDAYYVVRSGDDKTYPIERDRLLELLVNASYYVYDGQYDDTGKILPLQPLA